MAGGTTSGNLAADLPKPSGPAQVGQAGHAQWTRRNNAPVLMLSINGKSADDLLRRCVSFNYKRSLGKSAETRFVFRNDDRTVCDDSRLFPNTEWRFRFGFLNDLSPVRVAVIREVSPVYDLKRTVTITLYDQSLTMSQKSSGKNWGVVPSSYIVKQIAKDYGMKAVVDDSLDAPKKAWIQPGDINDIRYIRDLAAMIDFEVFVDGDPPTLHYRKKRYEVAPRGVLTYYDDPSEFSYVKKFAPKVKSLGPVAAGVSSTDSKETTKDATKNNQALAAQTNFNTRGVSGIVIVPVKADVTLPAPKGADTKSLAAASLQQMLDKANEANSSHPLTPSISCGDIFEWAGIERQLSGKWYCWEETHEINGTSSSTSITWKRNAMGKTTSAADALKNRNNQAVNGQKVVQVGLASTGVDPKLTIVPAPIPK